MSQLSSTEYYLIRCFDKYIFCEKRIETVNNENVICFFRQDISLNKLTSEFPGGYWQMSRFSLPCGDVVRISKNEYEILEGLSFSLSDHISYIEDLMINIKCEESNADCAIVSYTTTIDVAEYYIKNEEDGKWYQTAMVNSRYENIFLLNKSEGNQKLDSYLPFYLDNVDVFYTQVAAYAECRLHDTIEECIKRGLSLLYKTAEYVFNVNSTH